MKKWMCMIAWLCVAALLLPGCQPKEPESTEPIITWDSVPQLVYGQWEYEKLSVLPWYSGRTEINNFHEIVETELGYYMVYGFSTILYADKVNLANWVPVCGMPDCGHFGALHCHAETSSNWLFLKDGRLYFKEHTGINTELYFNKDAAGEIYVSTKLDGSDKRLEYVYEDMLISVWGGGSMSTAFLGNAELYCNTQMDRDGNSVTSTYLVDDRGGRVLEFPETLTDESHFGPANTMCSLWGEPLLCYEQWSGGAVDMELYRLEGDTLTRLDMKLDYGTNAYFSGNTLRVFKTGDGYYDQDITTGQEIKVADAYYEDGMGCVLAPNCVLETNMMHENYYSQPPQGESKMALFDGEGWREVAIPAELATVSPKHVLYVAGMTSDSIFLFVRDPATYATERMTSQLYRIPIGEGQLRLEFCGEIALRSR